MVKKKVSQKSAIPAQPSFKVPNAIALPPSHSNLPPKYQQRLLDIFSSAFSSTLHSSDFTSHLQEIKQALYNRDFAAAFGHEVYLETYAARWSPTRTLCYASILDGLQTHLQALCIGADGEMKEPNNDIYEDRRSPKMAVEEAPRTEAYNQNARHPPDQPDSEHTLRRDQVFSKKRLRMLSIGGCAAEQVAFASHLHTCSLRGNVTLLDSAPWSPIVTLLRGAITSPLPLSKYASATAKASNTPLVSPSDIAITVMQQDVLSWDTPSLRETFQGEPLLVTLMFTLNELYTTGGMGPTTRLLKTLGVAMPALSLLLVVDSPGSYSEAQVGREKQKKKYPMSWLLHHTLTGTEHVGYEWERLETEDSQWFRLGEGLVYPIQLENMRYQMHLYRKVVEGKS